MADRKDITAAAPTCQRRLIEDWAEKYDTSQAPSNKWERTVVWPRLARYAREMGENGEPAFIVNMGPAESDAKGSKATGGQHSSSTTSTLATPDPGLILHPMITPARLNGMVPIFVRIEHCIPRSGKVPRPGNTLCCKMFQTSIDTLHAPLLGLHGTSLECVRQSMREEYFSSFGHLHSGHVHPSERDGDLIVELYASLGPGCRDARVEKDNWNHLLALLSAVTPWFPAMAIRVPIATLIAKVTCNSAVLRGC